MKKTILAIISVLVIAILVTGCYPGMSKAKKAEKEAQEHLEDVEEELEKFEAAQRNTKTVTIPDEEEEEDDHISLTETATGDTTTFKKLGDPWRDKGVTEHCELDFPFECARYMSKDGILYLAIKNQGYGSKADHVTLYLDGEVCDPSDVYIETGQNKDFECYVSEDTGDIVSADMEIEYYKPTDKTSRLSKGSLAVLME